MLLLGALLAMFGSDVIHLKVYVYLHTVHILLLLSLTDRHKKNSLNILVTSP